MARRAIDVLVQKALRSPHRATASEAAGTGVNLGVSRSKRPVMAVLDIGAVGGSGTFDFSVEASEDGTNWSAALDHNGAAITWGQKTAAGRSFYSLQPKRHYRAGATTIASFTSVDYGLEIIGFASAAPVTQA